MQGRHILVTGGCGYIGSHCVLALLERGARVTVIDNLSTGFRYALDPRATLMEGDIAERDVVARACEPRPDAIIHFAARSLVGESMVQPLLYFHENTTKSALFFGHLHELGVAAPLVFSSTAAVYGDCPVQPIPEDAPLLPTNPYGWSKLAIEGALRSMVLAHGWRAMALRYFNAAGADPMGRAGENHDPETHLLPIIAKRIVAGNHCVTIFGNDWPTPDRTCIRDYIHVADLAEAHLLAVEYLLAQTTPTFEAINVGTGSGLSVNEVVSAFERVAGHTLEREYASRRAGDPAVLVASVDRARSLLGFTAKLSSIDTMAAHTLRWEQGRASRTL